MADLIVKNAHIVTEKCAFEGSLVIEGEKVVAIVQGNEQITAARSIDAEGRVIIPGLVDGHVHFNEPGREHWEGFRSGTMAAAAGGVTTVLEMPLNAHPPTISEAALDYKRQAIRGEAIVDYGLWGGLVDNNLADLGRLDAEGVIGFKAFMSHSGIDEFKRVDDGLLYAGLNQTRKLGNLIGLHAENEDVIRYLSTQLRSKGRTDRMSWVESRPPASEWEAIQRACFWAQVTGGNLHIVHITIPEGIRVVWETRQKGTNVTSETCPHYLFFDHEDFERIGPAAKCAPPLRSRKNVEALWECVLSGMVDVIGSDHSPCNWEEKAAGMADIWKAWGGISGIQTMLPAILTEGVHHRGLALQDLVRMMATNPARIFGLYPTKGTLQPGSDADFTILDLDEEWCLDSEDLFYKNKHSAYIGCTFKGKVKQTFVRGKLVFQDGNIQAGPGYGKALVRQGRYSLVE